MKKLLLTTMCLLGLVAWANATLTLSSVSSIDSSYTTASIEFSCDTASVDSSLRTYELFIATSATMPTSANVTISSDFTSPDTITYDRTTLSISTQQIYFWVVASDSGTADTSAVDSTTLAAFPFNKTYESPEGILPGNIYHYKWIYNQSQDTRNIYVPIWQYKAMRLWARANGEDDNRNFDTTSVVIRSGEFNNLETIWTATFASDTGQVNQYFNFWDSHDFTADTVGGTGGMRTWGREINLLFNVTDTSDNSMDTSLLDYRTLEVFLYFQEK